MHVQSLSLNFKWWLTKIYRKSTGFVTFKTMKQDAIPNLILQNLKIYLSNSTEKLVRMNYWCCQHSYFKISKFQPKISFWITCFCFDWWILFSCYYPRVLPKVNDAKTFKNPVVLFYTLRSQIICILAHLTGAFRIILI